MKKSVLFILVFIALFAFISCKKEKEERRYMGPIPYNSPDAKAPKWEALKTEKEAVHKKRIPAEVEEVRVEEFPIFEAEEYTVQSGDNLRKIAKKFPGAGTANIICRDNRDVIKDCSHIEPGWKLRIIFY